ncbi:MAG: KUP/HAK/KT family potassium transporter [Phycisphaerales bacterium]|nr:KUP/HAK/KT family potassium transporter [Phycisphaerales bacterium]
MNTNLQSKHNFSSFGIIVALGIVFGDIGTSPLYVITNVISNHPIEENFIKGMLSCIIWTILLIGTLKYVFLVLKADNNGEGGIFSLFSLVRRRARWLIIVAIIGGAAILADSIITAPISVTSAIEGVMSTPFGQHLTKNNLMVIVVIILSLLFFIQQFGTDRIGAFFGFFMVIWFLFIGVIGFMNIQGQQSILIWQSFNPSYALYFIIYYPKGFIILGSIFLCCSGAEAMYSDLGHCGRRNIELGWILVKVCIILNYIGQCCFLLAHYKSRTIPEAEIHAGFNSFYNMIPQAWRVFSIIIATLATIIASQSLISGSYSLVMEAIRLNIFPKLKALYPGESKEQVYIPAVNWIMLSLCIFVVFYFRTSEKMAAAYGLSISLCMIATTILFAYYLLIKYKVRSIVYSFLIFFLAIESTFLISNLYKFFTGGYMTVIFCGVLCSLMWTMIAGRKILKKYEEFTAIKPFLPLITKLIKDTSVPLYSNHLAYITHAELPQYVERKILYSLLHKQPKRANVIWLIHLSNDPAPYTCTYSFTKMTDNIMRLDFNLGFKVDPKIHIFFESIVSTLIKNAEITLPALQPWHDESNILDTQFVLIENKLGINNQLSFIETLFMKMYFSIKRITENDASNFGLDHSQVLVEQFPLVVTPITNATIQRI